MPTITVDVADFTNTGTPPARAVLQVGRATIDVSGTVVITTAIKDVQLVNGHGVFTVDGNAAYWARFSGVAGLVDEWYFQTSVNCTAADLYRVHQIDPGTLAPLPTFPTVAAAIADLRADLTALEANVGAPEDPATGLPVDQIPNLTLLFENGLI